MLMARKPNVKTAFVVEKGSEIGAHMIDCIVS
jgi:hypothetical protein